MRRSVIAVSALAACALAPAFAGASSGPVKTVTLHDDYYSPSKLTVRSGTTIRWVWQAGLTNTHDVMLGARPRGVKTFMSDYAAGGYSYKHKLTTRGKYTFLCDLHQGMKMTVTVK